MARMVARYLPKYLPGKPNVIVENMPGASGMVGANYVYNIAKPDGLTLGAINRVIPAAELLKIDGVKFELLKYSWVGAAAVESSAFVVRNDLPYKTIEDLKKVKEFNVGATGPGDSTYNFAILIKQYLGINLKITSGYPGTGDIALAVERKELDGYTGAYSSQRPYIARKLLRPILRSGIPSPGIEKLPSAEDLTTDPMAKTIFKMYSVSDRVGRPYVCPPRDTGRGYECTEGCLLQGHQRPGASERSGQNADGGGVCLCSRLREGNPVLPEPTAGRGERIQEIHKILAKDI